jgi:hypothetical protein
MGDSTPSFLTGCKRLGVCEFSPSLVAAGGWAPALKKKLLIDNDAWKSDRPPQEVGSN